MKRIFANWMYATRGIIAEVEPSLQTLLWELLDAKAESGQELDYLQIFELSVVDTPAGKVQRIVHRQEQPFFRDIHECLRVEYPIELRIWVIDDGDHATMLLPSEY